MSICANMIVYNIDIMQLAVLENLLARFKAKVFGHILFFTHLFMISLFPEYHKCSRLVHVTWHLNGHTIRALIKQKCFLVSMYFPTKQKQFHTCLKKTTLITSQKKILDDFIDK